MLNVQELAVWAGAIMSIVALIGFIVRPVLKMMDNLTKMGHSLDILNNDLQASKSDRTSIHLKLEKHETKLDNHEVQLSRHEERLKNLYHERGR